MNQHETAHSVQYSLEEKHDIACIGVNRRPPASSKHGSWVMGHGSWVKDENLVPGQDGFELLPVLFGDLDSRDTGEKCTVLEPIGFVSEIECLAVDQGETLSLHR
jgi:hypothetical protein